MQRRPDPSALLAVSSSRAGRMRLQLLSWFVAALCLASLLVFAPFWASLILATWAAMIVRPLFERVAGGLHRRRAAAALCTALLVLAFLTPLLVATLSLAGAALDLIQRLLESKSGADALRSLVADGRGAEFNLQHLEPRSLLELGRRHGEDALRVARSLFGAVTVLVLGVVIFVAAFYCLLLQGRKTYVWLVAHLPLPRSQIARFAAAFSEVGRGLVIGMGLTGLVQGTVATVGFLLTGVPQALVLGLVTVFASFIPSLGAALVWMPVTAGLALSGRTGSALVMLVFGGLASLVDNVLRPVLTRYGKLHLHGFVLFLAMLGGLAVFGSGGILLGPLFVRLAIEGLALLREAAPAVFPDSPA